jgi:hypothetical protein
MSILKKSDVKNHLSLRFRARTYMNTPESGLDPSGDSLAEPAAVGMSPAAFAMDYSAEHTIADTVSAQAANSTDSAVSQEPAPSKSAQA